MTDETEVEIVTRLQAVDIRDLYPDLAPEDASSRVCLLCAAKLKDKTHNLTRHLERHHAGALLQLLEQRNGASPALLAAKSKRVQQEKSAASRVAAVEDALKADDAKVALARWLAHEQLPVDLVQKPGFRAFLETLNEQFEPPRGDELRQLLGSLMDDEDPTVEMMALRATCRCSEDSPLVALTRVACDIPRRGEAKVRVARAAASYFDAQVCRGKVLGKNGVLGRAFVGVVVDVQSPNPRASDAAVDDSINVFDRVVASPYLTRPTSSPQPESPELVDSCLGVSAPSGALAEYVVLPTANLCVVPSAVPDDLALLADDMSVVLAIAAELQQRSCRTVAILSDSASACLTTLLTRYLQDASQAQTHVFTTCQGVRFPHASTTFLDIYQPAATSRVLSQNELCIDVCVDLLGSDTSGDFAASLVQSMGCLVLVDRSRLQLDAPESLAMDLNAVVVRELDVAAIRDCRAFLRDAVRYLDNQAQSPQRAAELRRCLLPQVLPLPQALEELQTMDALTYLQVAPQI